MITSIKLHPTKDDTPIVIANRGYRSRWIDIKIGSTEITIFTVDAEHQQEIIAALKGDA